MNQSTEQQINNVMNRFNITRHDAIIYLDRVTTDNNQSTNLDVVRRENFYKRLNIYQNYFN